MRWQVLVFIALVMAGCTSPAASPPEAAELPLGYGFTCPGGATGTPCHVRFDSTEFHYTEPYATAHPHDPDVWAIGAMAGGNPAYTTEDPLNGWSVGDIHFWFTEDDGDTWRPSVLPTIANPSPEPFVYRALADPVIILENDSIVHVTGIITFIYASTGPVNRWEIFYARSTDLGRSWEDTVLLTDGGFDDRNWMVDADGRIVTVWTHYAERDDTLVAWSDDKGQTWEKDSVLGCSDVGQPIHVEEVLFVCRVADSIEEGEMVVHAFDGAARELGRFEANCWRPHLLDLAEGFAVIPAFCRGGTVWTSTTDFQTWSPLQPVAELVGVPVSQVLWQTIDEVGNLHILTSEAPEGQEIAAAEESRVTYSVVDLKDRTPIKQKLLHDFAPHPDTRPPQSTGIGGSYLSVPVTGDHYNGLAWSDGRGLIAWSFDGGIHASFIKAGVEQDGPPDLSPAARGG